MNKTYEVAWSEKKTTSTGKPVINASLKDETGATIDKVSIWGDFPNFANIMTGHKVTGSLYTNPKGYIALYPPKAEGTSAGGAYTANKGSFGAKMMEKKAENIKEAQERKNDSIAFFNATNSAIALVSQEYAKLTKQETKEAIVVWRNFFLSEWEKYNNPTSPVDMTKEPFE